MQAVKARKITEPIPILRVVHRSSNANDLATIWSTFGETKNMLHKLEDQAGTPPKLVHSHKARGRTVQFSNPLPDKRTSNNLQDSVTQSSDTSSIVDGDYLNNRSCVLHANSEEIDHSSPLNMEPLRSTSSSREDEVPTVTTLHSNKGAIFGPPVSFDVVPSVHNQSPPKSVSAPNMTSQLDTHQVPLRKFQIPESAIPSLKRTIEQQKLAVQASEMKLESVMKHRMEPLTTDSGEEAVTVHGGMSKPVRRKLHNTSDPVFAASGAPTNCSKKRKIAVAPSPPNYAQTRSTRNSVKQPHVTASSSEAAPLKIASKPKVTVRKVAAKVVEQASQRKYQTNITPSSWRAGRDVVHRVLGPSKKKPTKLPQKEPQDDLMAGDSSSSIASSTDSVGLAVRSKKGFLSEVTTTSPKRERSLLNSNAIAVLNEVGLSEEDTHPPPKPTTFKIPRRSLSSVPKLTSPEPIHVPKVRHYDADKVRDYMEKKREDRKKKNLEQRYIMKRAETEKKRKLEILDMDRRQVLQNNLKRAGVKRQQKLLEDMAQHPGIHIHLEEANADSDKENKLRSSSPVKQHDSVLSGHVFTSSSLLDTLALSGNKQTIPSAKHTLSESVSNQRPPTGSIPTAQSLRSISPVSKSQQPLSSVEVMNEQLLTVSSYSTPIKSPSPVVITKQNKISRSSRRSPDLPMTSRDAAKPHRRAHMIKQSSSTFNTRDLPGVHNVDQHAHKAIQHHKQEEAVTRIQAAYRGHQVRKSLHWNTSTYQKVHRSKSTPLASSTDGHKHCTTTRTKKSTKKKVQDKAKPVVEVSLESVHLDPTHSNVHDTGSVPVSSVPPWEQAGGDMMSVINIYTRQYEKLQEQFNATAALHAERCKQAFSSSSVTSQPSSLASTSLEEQPNYTENTRPSLASKGSPHHQDNQQDGTYTDHTPLYSNTFEPVTATPTGDQVITQAASDRSFDPDSLQTPARDSEASTDSLSCVSMEEENDQSSLTFTSASVSQQSHMVEQDDARLQPPEDIQPALKYSPGGLEQKLTAELALLESVSDSLQQLNNVEGARAISAAQQETADLANMLKARQQAHEIEMKSMAQRAHEEMLQTKQQLQQMQQSAAERLEELTKQTLHQSVEQQHKIEEVQQHLLVARTPQQHTATQTVTPPESSKATLPATKGDDDEVTTTQLITSHTTSHCYTTDFEDDTVPASNMGYSADVSIKDNKKETSEVTEDISSEGDTLVEQQQHNSQLDDTLQNTVDSVMVDSDEEDSVSFRMVLPSESHRKQSKGRLRSAGDSVSSLATSHGDLSGVDAHTSSDGEESFCDFVSRMVRQYTLEEETRAQHQQALLKLREKALQEKNQLEMQWLNIKKQKLHNKGEDDKMPPIKKKQRELMRKFQLEQAEIQRLQQASKQASQERKLLLKEQEDINKIRKSSQVYKDKLKQLLEGDHDMSLSSVSSVSAVSSDSSEGAPTSVKKSISKTPAEVPSTSTPSSTHSTHKTTQQVIVTEESIAEEVSELHEHVTVSSTSQLIKTAATSFPTYSPLDEVLSISGISSDREDEGKASDQHTSTDKDIATSTDSIPKQLKKLKLSEKYLTQREKKVLKRKAAAEAALKKQRELMLREQEITKQEEEVNNIINQAMECFYQRKEAQKCAPPALDVSSVVASVPTKTEHSDNKSLIEDKTMSSVEEELSEGDQQVVKTATTTQVTELYGNESFETLEVTSQLHTAATVPTVIASSTPRTAVDSRKITSSDISDSLKMSDSLTETTATTVTSEASTDIEARIRMLKEQLKQRREEVKKSQQEQKRKKRALLKQKEAELKQKLEAVESRAAAMKEVTLVATSEGSADVSESDMEEKTDQLPLQSTNKVDTEMYGYTPFSDDITHGQATTMELSTTALSAVDTIQEYPTTVITSQLSAAPDEVLTEVIAQSSPPSSPTTSTVSVSSSLVYSEKDIVEGESADIIEQLDDTLTEPLLPPHDQDDDQTLEFHDQVGTQTLNQHKEPHDQVPVQHNQVTVQHDQTTRQDKTATTYDKDVSTDLDHSTIQEELATKFDHSNTSQHQDETIIQSDKNSLVEEPKTSIPVTSQDHSTPAIVTGQDHSTPAVVTSQGHSAPVTSQGHSAPVTSQDHSTPAVVTSQEVSSEPEDISSRTQSANQPPVEATLPSKASEVDLSDSQPATEVSEASSIVYSETNELPALEPDEALSFKVGQQVLIGQKMIGVIQFVGQTMFAPGVWIGVELDLAKGTNDGSMDGIRYFTCEPSHGLFAPPSKVELQPTRSVSPPAPSSLPSDKPLSPDVSLVSTEQASSADEATYSIHKENEKVDTVTAGLVDKIADEAVQEMTTIWCSKIGSTVANTPDVMVNTVTDELFALLLRSEVEVMCKMNEKKKEEPIVKTPTKQLKLSTRSLELSPPPVLTPPSPFYFDHPSAKISPSEEVSPLRPVTVDLNRADSPPRQQRILAGDISPPHSPPLSPVATAARPLSESRSSSVESITQLLESHPVDTSQFLVPNERSAVDVIVASAWNCCLQLTTEALHSEEIVLTPEATKLPQGLAEEEIGSVMSYQELVFELAVEVIRELRPRQAKPRPVWMPPVPVSLSREPVTLDRVQSIVYTRLMKGQLPFSLPVARYIHGGRRVCGRDVDFVEALLIKELRSEEREWTNYDDDEEHVKLQTADAILESLLIDTINVMNNIVSRKSAKM